MADIFISHCDVLGGPAHNMQVNTDQDLHVQGNRIRSIMPAGTQTPPPGARLLDGRGKLAIPGLMNTHTHMPMVLFRGLAEDVSFLAWFNDYIFPLESNLNAEDVYWGALLALAEMIQNGVTFAADHYFYMDEVARAVEEAGTRADLAWAVFGHEGEAKVDRTCEFVQRWHGKADGRITARLGPHAPYTTSVEFLRMCADKAHALGVGTHTHVSETADQVAMSKRDHGVTPVQVLAESGILETPVILAHCLFPEEEDYELIRKAGAGVAHAPKTYLKLGMGTAPVREFRRRGIPVGLATDGAVSSNTLDVLEQLRLTALTQKGAVCDSTVLPVREALEIAFDGSARVLQREEDLGSLEPGKLADVVLLRQDGVHTFPRYDPAANLVYSSQTSDVDTVICNGEVLMEGRRLLTIDKERVMAEVTTRLERLNRRVPGVRIATYPV